jgi:hypothetical protein
MPARGAWCRPQLGAAAQVIHLTVVLGGEPAFEHRGRLGGAKGGDPREIESDSERLCLESRLEGRGPGGRGRSARAAGGHPMRAAQRA